MLTLPVQSKGVKNGGSSCSLTLIQSHQTLSADIRQGQDFFTKRWSYAGKTFLLIPQLGKTKSISFKINNMTGKDIYILLNGAPIAATRSDEIQTQCAVVSGPTTGRWIMQGEAMGIHHQAGVIHLDLLWRGIAITIVSGNTALTGTALCTEAHRLLATSARVGGASSVLASWWQGQHRHPTPSNLDWQRLIPGQQFAIWVYRCGVRCGLNTHTSGKA